MEKADGGPWIKPGGQASLFFPHVPKSQYQVSLRAKAESTTTLQVFIGFKFSSTDRREFIHNLDYRDIPGGNRFVTQHIESHADLLPYTIAGSIRLPALWTENTS